MKHVKLLRLNEELTRLELAEELKKAKYIQVAPISDKQWGILYFINGEKKSEGGFNTNYEAHEFLNDNNIDYGGRDGFLTFDKYRDRKSTTEPYRGYQKELMRKGLSGLFDLD